MSACSKAVRLVAGWGLLWVEYWAVHLAAMKDAKRVERRAAHRVAWTGGLWAERRVAPSAEY